MKPRIIKPANSKPANSEGRLYLKMYITLEFIFKAYEVFSQLQIAVGKIIFAVLSLSADKYLRGNYFSINHFKNNNSIFKILLWKWRWSKNQSIKAFYYSDKISPDFLRLNFFTFSHMFTWKSEIFNFSFWLRMRVRVTSQRIMVTSHIWTQ